MTIRYLHEGSGATDSDCTPAEDYNEKAVLSPTDTSDLSSSVGIGPHLTHAWTTEPDNPNDADWPNGDYVLQVYVHLNQLAAGIDLETHRVSSGCTSQETIGSTTGLTGTGAKTLTTTADPSAGSASDRYQGRVTGDNTGSTMSKSLTLRVSNSDPDDSYQEGPWTVATPSHPYIPQIARNARQRRARM